MRRPPTLTSDEPLLWSTGTGNQVWRLFQACIAGDLATVRELIDEDPALVRCQFAYRGPLYFAVRENQLEVADLLLARGANPVSSGIDDDLVTVARDRGLLEMERLLGASLEKDHGASARGEPLAAAIRAYDPGEVIRMLDDSPSLLQQGDERSNRPIHWAVMTRQIDLIDELLRRGAYIDEPRQDGARPIHLCNGDYHFRGWRDVPVEHPTTPQEVLQHLRDHGANVDMCTAASLGDRQRVEELLAEDPALAATLSPYVTYYVGSGTPLGNAAARGHHEIVKLLLEHGADPNQREEGIAPRGHALYLAAANKHHDIAKTLLESGAFPNPPVESSADALTRAVANRDREMIDLLCSYGAVQDLELLAYEGDTRVAAAILRGDPARADDPDALVNAAWQGKAAFVRLLLRYQPDLPKRVMFPSWAVGAPTRELNELLFAHGLSASQPDWMMVTPLHRFAQHGDVERAVWFIANGADLEAVDEENSTTPLGWAAKYGSLPMAELLLQQGAKAQPENVPSFATPLSWALRRGNDDIADALRSKGATE